MKIIFQNANTVTSTNASGIYIDSSTSTSITSTSGNISFTGDGAELILNSPGNGGLAGEILHSSGH